MEELREEYPDRKILVVDSLGASSGYGLLVDAAADLRDQGLSLEEVYRITMKRRLHVHHWFFSPRILPVSRGRPYFGNLGHAGNRTKHMPADEHGSRGTFNSAPEDQNEEKAMQGSGQMMELHAEGKTGIQREMFYLLFRLRRRRKGRGRSCGGALPGAGRKRADQQHWNRDRCPYGAGNRGSVLFFGDERKGLKRADCDRGIIWQFLPPIPGIWYGRFFDYHSNTFLG